jgi:hypothetical protein
MQSIRILHYQVRSPDGDEEEDAVEVEGEGEEEASWHLR